MPYNVAVSAPFVSKLLTGDDITNCPFTGAIQMVVQENGMLEVYAQECNEATHEKSVRSKMRAA